MTRISIVTLSFNQAQYLEEALDSVLSQDHPDVEYIVVDPGSTDGSLEIIERYRHRLAKVILGPDQGPADGLNRGFAVATGDVFGYLNSDDRLLPGALSTIARHFDADPALDIISGHLHIIDAKGNVTRRAYTDRFSWRGFAYGTWGFCQPSTFFRAGAYRAAGGFNIAHTTCWDRDLMFRMFSHTQSYKIIDKILADFRIYGQSITGSKRFRAIEEDIFQQHFRKIIGEKRPIRDFFALIVLYIAKYAREPRSLRERILRGNIFKQRSPK